MALGDLFLIVIAVGIVFFFRREPRERLLAIVRSVPSRLMRFVHILIPVLLLRFVLVLAIIRGLGQLRDFEAVSQDWFLGTLGLSGTLAILCLTLFASTRNDPRIQRLFSGNENEDLATAEELSLTFFAAGLALFFATLQVIIGIVAASSHSYLQSTDLLTTRLAQWIAAIVLLAPANILFLSAAMSATSAIEKVYVGVFEAIVGPSLRLPGEQTS